eukprot:CAMPEP_0184526836 /NCGR_PEP_ID=MMETSP0198_2-20121128/10874_1 /TAXON_ID=1112570 /ORGANISM="Thraustochytrium sp., Strain LLF1b" /LENGTH=34 /DNA_ID= /DNA_START= /DNA_END= /DNA_ORIENTATION=
MKAHAPKRVTTTIRSASKPAPSLFRRLSDAHLPS